MKTCGQCINFTGGGDWGLCCRKPPKKAKDSYFGWLCYSYTEAEDCENYTPVEVGDKVLYKNKKYKVTHIRLENGHPMAKLQNGNEIIFRMPLCELKKVDE